DREKPIEAVGWASEHLQMPGVVHLWETSQVLLYLTHYASMLQQHISRALLRGVGLSLREVAVREIRREQHAVHTICMPDSSNLADLGPGDQVLAILEPLKGDRYSENSAYRVYRHAARHYLAPRHPEATAVAAGQEHWSILLYGPPGTGKTTFA